MHKNTAIKKLKTIFGRTLVDIRQEYNLYLVLMKYLQSFLLLGLTIGAVCFELAHQATPANGEDTGKVGRVRGAIQLYKMVDGKKQPVQDWNFAHTVVYLVPSDQELAIQAPEKHAVISQKNAKFAPELIVITKGQTVDFPNDDDIPHNVFSFSKAKKFDLGTYPQGVKKSVKFDQEGPVLLFCSIHENMNGVIYVTPNQLHTIADSQGNFTIQNVPVGKYRLRTWDSSLPEAVESVYVKDVDVASGKPVDVAIDISNFMGAMGKKQ